MRPVSRTDKPFKANPTLAAGVPVSGGTGRRAVRPWEAEGDSGRAKQTAILAALRERVVAGKLRPGDQLPTHVQLAEEFATSPVTIQRVLDRLSHEGWVVSVARKGTFVASRPPHVGSYGLVLGESAVDGDHPSRSHFYESLVHEAIRSTRFGGERTYRTYTGIGPHVDTEDFRRLEADLRTHRVSGLILLDPYISMESPLIHDSPMPRVGVQDYEIPGVPAVNADKFAWLDLAMDAMRECGCRTVAVLMAPQMEPAYIAAVREKAAVRDIETRTEWLAGVHCAYPHWARNIIRMIFGGPSRPQGLLITDDHLVEHATGGIAELGLRVPENLHIIAHANFPAVTPAVTPARRLGMHLPDILDTCVRILEAQLRGEKVPSMTRVRPVFQEALIMR